MNRSVLEQLRFIITKYNNLFLYYFFNINNWDKFWTEPIELKID